jgi:hypothetical protein
MSNSRLAIHQFLIIYHLSSIIYYLLSSIYYLVSIIYLCTVYNFLFYILLNLVQPATVQFFKKISR